MPEILKKILSNNAIQVVALAIICLITVKIVLFLCDKLLNKSHLDSTVRKILRMTLKVLLLFTAAVIVLSKLGISVSSFVATLSVVGVAVSLAIQGFLSNVFGGMQIISNKPFNVGDYVEAGGESGTVREVGLFYTKLDTPDKKLIQIPNSIIANSNITNYSSAINRRVEINVAASYDDDVEKVKSIILKLVSEHSLVIKDAELAPAVHVKNYGDSNIEYVARAWCKNSDYWTVYFDIMDSVKPTFDKNGITISFNTVNVNMKQ